MTLSPGRVLATFAPGRRDVELPSGGIVCPGGAFMSAPVTTTRPLQTRPRLAGLQLSFAVARRITRCAAAQLGQARRDLLATPASRLEARLGIGTRTLGTEPNLLVPIHRHPPSLAYA